MPGAAKPVSPLVRVPLRYGLIGGLIGAVVLVVLYYIKVHPLLVATFFDFRVALFGLLLFATMKEYRDVNNGGTLMFGQGLMMSMVFLTTFAVTASFLLWIFTIIVPGFVIDYIDLATKQLKGFPAETIDKIGRDVYEENLAKLPGTTGFDLATLYFAQCYLIGFFISIIISVILRTQPAGPEEGELK